MATGITISILQQYFSRLIAKFLNCTSDLLIRHDRGGKTVIFRQWQPGAAWNAKNNDWLDLRVKIVGALLLSSAAELSSIPGCLGARSALLPSTLSFKNLPYLTLRLTKPLGCRVPAFAVAAVSRSNNFHFIYKCSSPGTMQSVPSALASDFNVGQASRLSLPIANCRSSFLVSNAVLITVCKPLSVWLVSIKLFIFWDLCVPV